jgi:hypothetical protein
MLSPLKGSDLRVAKVYSLYYSNVIWSSSQSNVEAQTDQDGRVRSKHATNQDLPEGANKDAAWTRLVVPNFIRLLLAGEQPWLIGDDVFISELQKVWNHVYGRSLPFIITKGTASFKIVSNLSCLLYVVFLIVP